MKTYNWKVLIFTSFCTLLFSTLGLAQLEDPTQGTKNQDPQLQRAEEYIERAKEFYAQAQYEASIKEYQFAAAIYRKTNHPELYAICYNGVGNNYINLSRYKEAYTEFKRGLSLFDEIANFQPDTKIDSSIIADAYEGLGRYYMNVDVDFEKALFYHQEALRLRILGEVPEDRVALSYFFIGKCYRHFTIDSTDAQEANIINPLKQELAFYERALEIQERTIGKKHYQTADTYAAIANYYNEIKSNFQKGFEYNLKALGIRKNVFREGHPKIASSYLGIATFYRILNMFDKEREYLEKALEIQLKTLGNEHADVAKSYYLLGNRNSASGDFEQALDYYERSLLIYEELFTENSVEVAELYEQIALCYRGLEEHSKEFAYLEKALEINKNIYGEEHFKIGSVLMEMGTYFGNIQEYDSLLYYYETATEIWKEQLGKDHYFIATAHDNLAKAHQLRNESEKEFYYLNEALNRKSNEKAKGIQKIYLKEAQETQTAFEENNNDNVLVGSELFKSYMNLADFYKRKSDYKLALLYIQNALAAVCESVSAGNVDIYKNPTVEELSHNIAWLRALEQKGSLFLKLYQDDKQRKNLTFANETYNQALTLIDTLRVNFSSDGSKQQLTSRSIPVYEGAIETLHTLYKTSRNPQFLYKAFEVMEKSKGFVLLQALQGISARNYSGVPPEMLAREEYLRRNLAYYSDFKNRENNQDENFDAAYFDTKKAYDSLVTRLEKDYPRYYFLKYQSRVASLKEVQSSLLHSRNLLLEYFVGDEHIYVFKITADYQSFYKVPIPNDMERMVTSLRNALTDYQLIGKDPQLAYKNYVVASHSFYKTFVMQFLTGVDASIDQLIVIPDGWMSYIPFSVLLEDLPKDLNVVDYQNLSYLLNRFEINYNYSSTLMLQNLSDQRTGENNNQCLGFAPSYGNSETMGASAELPWAEKELNAVQKSLDGKFYFGLDATKDYFKQYASDYAVIHLAMHGIVNIRNSEKSILVFAKDDKRLDNDEFLYAYEIHNMNLNADLVVLSACETGFGKVVRGEGVLSLARAFMYAGVPSVVTTLWKVNDYTSATLMTYFYENLDKGMTKPEALRQAKQTYLKQSDQVSGHPAFWASFVTIGNPAPLNYGFPFWVWPVLGIGVALLLFFMARLLLTRRQRRKRRKAEEEQFYGPQPGVDI